MPADFIPTGVEYLRILPELILTLVATLLMVLEPLTPARRKGSLGYLALAGLAVALVSAGWGAWVQGLAFSGMVTIDGFAVFFRVLVIAAAMLVVLTSLGYLRREDGESGEYYALLLYSVAGQCIMASANHLIVIFIGLEISSIASYVLAGYMRREKLANEASVKYFLLGSFATAFLLYGIALIYGTTGTADLTAIRGILADPQTAPSGVLVGAAAALMFVGFGFKISAAPFQVWAPDVYQGAPAPITAFLAAGPKAAAFAIFLRVYMTAFGPVVVRWEQIVWTSALLTMIVGNFAALRQRNVKRLLAYSSIAHAGYAMAGIAAHSNAGTAAVMFYMASYVCMNIGAFAIITYFSRRGEQYVDIDDFAGLAWRKPGMAAMFSIFLLSFIGVPLTGGFFAKFYVFTAALDAHLTWLTVLGLLNSAVAAYYYLRLLVVMYMHEAGETTADLPRVPFGTGVTIIASAAMTLLLGIFPSVILSFAERYSDLGK